MHRIDNVIANRLYVLYDAVVWGWVLIVHPECCEIMWGEVQIKCNFANINGLLQSRTYVQC